LGLYYLNTARDTNISEDERVDAWTSGIKYLQSAFKLRVSASAAVGLCKQLAKQRKWDTVRNTLKKNLVPLGCLCSSFSDDKIERARVTVCRQPSYLIRSVACQRKGVTRARKEGRGNTCLQHVCFYQPGSDYCCDSDRRRLSIQRYAQAFVDLSILLRLLNSETGEYPAAVNTFENVLSKNPRCIEAIVGLAAIRAHLTFSAHSLTEAAEERKQAVELYERALRLFMSSQKDHRVQAVAQDPDLWVDAARLWAEEDAPRSLRYYRDALRLREERGLPPSPQLLNNIGCLEFAKGRFGVAEEMFGSALTSARDVEQSGAGSADSVGATTITYNLGVVYESQGDKEKASRVYDTMVLARHPEWIEGRLIFFYIK
jgi:RNA polymerase-associated protein CTR9